MLAMLCVAGTAMAENSAIDTKKVLNLQKEVQLREATSVVKKEKAANVQKTFNLNTQKAMRSISDQKQSNTGLHMNGQATPMKVIGMRKADSNTSIEGTWTFTLGDYYFQNSVGGSITCDFEATLQGNLVVFEDPTGYEVPFVAEYSEAAATLTFNREFIGTASGYYVYQEPFVYNYDTNDLDIQTIVATYNASAGTISFQRDNGISWPAYTDEAGTAMEGYFGIYDLEGATKTGGNGGGGSGSTSIEGTWTFSLGDYYFQNSTLETLYVDFEATLQGNQVVFEDPTGEEVPFVADYDDATSSLTFNRRLIATSASYYIYQEPFVYNYDTNELDIQTIVGTYNASAGTISFQRDNGISWPAYTDEACTAMAGYFGIYDLEGATKTGDNGGGGSGDSLDEEQAGQWTSVGMATFVDAWILPSYSISGVGINPNEYPYEVELQQNVANPNVYRLWKPYKSAGALVYDQGLNQSTYQGQIVFDITDPDHVIVKPGMPAGFKNSNGDFYVFGLLGWQIHHYGAEYDGSQLSGILDFMKENDQPFDTYKDGVVSINKSVFDIDSACSKAYTWQNNEYIVSTITFPTNTGISIVKSLSENDNTIYNLQGQKVEKAQKGLYIINGKKVILK